MKERTKSVNRFDFDVKGTQSHLVFSLNVICFHFLSGKTRDFHLRLTVRDVGRTSVTTTRRIRGTTTPVVGPGVKEVEVTLGEEIEEIQDPVRTHDEISSVTVEEGVQWEK